MIKFKKDLQHCISRTKIKVPRCGDKKFFEVYLWDSNEAMLGNTERELDEDKNMMRTYAGLCCHMPYTEIVPDVGPVVIKSANKLGELHFIKDDWDLEIVAHECYHATTNICKILLVDPAQNIRFEEKAAYIHGELVNAVYDWLWEVDDSSLWNQICSYCKKYRWLLSWPKN